MKSNQTLDEPSKASPNNTSPELPKTSADGNLQAKADATPNDLKSSALSNHGIS